MPLYTNIDSQAGQPKHINVGQVKGITVSGTMTGYVDGASLTISAPPAGGVQAIATIKVTAGAITGIVFSNQGAGYTAPPTITAPTGTGATFTSVVAVNKTPNSQVVFVSYEESQLTDNRIKGLRTPGWYRVKEKLGSDGQVRFMYECLVASTVYNSVSGDGRSDNAVAGNVEITITTQPSNSAVTAPSAASFTVVGTGITTYQWQVQTAGIGAYVDLTDTGVYTLSTTASFAISNTTGLNGNRYRVNCGNGGTAQVRSRGATLAVA